MKIHSHSAFKDPGKDTATLQTWIDRLQQQNSTVYQRIDIATSLGRTTVWGINTDKPELKPLVIFPGFRTSSLFWDFDSALDVLRPLCRIYLVETNGQPTFSEGNTPDIKSDNYGHWAAEVLRELKLDKASIAGASFGGLVCMKLCMVAPQLIEKCFLLNPGCLQGFSMSLSNLYYNLLPIISPSPKNVSKFLDKAVFCKPNHQLTPATEQLIIDYEVFALTRFTDKAQKPYAMGNDELGKVSTPVYLLLGDKDLLFPYAKSEENARKNIMSLKEVYVLKDTAHGIETSKEAMGIIAGNI